MNRMPLLALAALLLAAVGIVVGQCMRRNSSREAPASPEVSMAPPTQIIEGRVPMPAVPTPEANSSISVVSYPPVAAPPAYGTPIQAVAQYKAVTKRETTVIRAALKEIRRHSRISPADAATNEAARESWAQEEFLPAVIILYQGEFVLKIKNVPASCRGSHELLTEVARRSRTFVKTYNTAGAGAGESSAEVDRQARELEASLSAFDASLAGL